MKNLPLSWSFIDTNQNSSVTISKWNLSWLAINILPFNSIFNFNNNIVRRKNLLIRGCNEELANQLEKKGYSKIHFGIEAILNTKQNHFDKKSLSSLIRRGQKHGKVIKVLYSIENKKKFDQLKQNSTHSDEPQLKNLFQTEFNENHFLYAFISNKNEWLGGVLASVNSSRKIHTELLLRKNDSPNGMMESILFYMFNDVKSMGFEQLSLGEVPFHFSEKNSSDKFPFNLGKTGNFVNYAYNHKGLFDFKNKFQPEWKPLYICSSEKIGLKHFFFIIYSSNFHSLLIFKLYEKFKDLVK